MFPFYTRWKQRFSGLFRGYKMETLARSGLIYLSSDYCRRRKCTNCQYMLAMYLAILKHLYLNHCLFSFSMPVQELQQKMKFSIKDFFCKSDQICRKLQIWSHLLKKSLTENVIFCAVLLLTCPHIIFSCQVFD